MIKGIIFDLDGVLVSTDYLHYQAWKKMADDEGVFFDEKINNRLRGVSRMASLEIILEKSSKKYTQTEKEQLASIKNSIYIESLKSLSPKSVSHEVRETLSQLRKAGVKLAVGSGSKNAKLIMKQVDLEKYFDSVSDGENLENPKPNPEVFLKAAAMLGLPAYTCAVVEDARAGIDAANNGNFTSIGVGDAASYDKADYRISSIEQIQKIAQKGIIFFHLSKEYSKGIKAVDDFTLEIADREFLVLVGPSGCGKSTTLRMVAGLESVTDGEIYINGKLINDVEPKDRNIAMVFQNYALYPQLTIAQNIGFPLKMNKLKSKGEPFKVGNYHKFSGFCKYLKYRLYKLFATKHMPKKEIQNRVNQVAEILGLKDYLHRRPSELSGGQKQRVALGRAIIRHPDVFLLDEPLSNLDAKMRSQMRTEITKLHNKLKTTFIYVTHDQTEAMTMGTVIVVMNKGKIQQVGSPTNIFDHPVNKFVAGFIGSPQMNFIRSKVNIKNNNVTLSFGIFSIDLPSDVVAKINNVSGLDDYLYIGIRPKDAVIISKPDRIGLCGKVVLAERLGDETLIYLSISGKEDDYVIEIDSNETFEPGQEIYFAINMEKIHLFSTINEKRCIE